MSEQLVILRIGSGSCHEGFNSTLQIWSSSGLSTIQGSLPPCMDLVKYYQKWSFMYEDLFPSSSRMEALHRTPHHGKVLIEELNQTTKDGLKEHFLKSSSLRNPIFLIINNFCNEQLRLLPWHIWDFFDDQRFGDLELVLSPVEIIPLNLEINFPIKILAVFADNDDLNFDKEKKEWQKHGAKFFHFTKLTDFLDSLENEEGWDILYFAGHSQTNDNQGKLAISPSHNLPLKQIKPSLRLAIKNGLKLAIFNSCHGLGLAQDLLALNIPEVVVMRNFIPDAIAPIFLKNFLNNLTKSGMTTALALRLARERLISEGADQEYPGITWLPILCANPTNNLFIWPKYEERTFQDLDNHSNVQGENKPFSLINNAHNNEISFQQISPAFDLSTKVVIGFIGIFFIILAIVSTWWIKEQLRWKPCADAMGVRFQCPSDWIREKEGRKKFSLVNPKIPGSKINFYIQDLPNSKIFISSEDTKNYHSQIYQHISKENSEYVLNQPQPVKLNSYDAQSVSLGIEDDNRIFKIYLWIIDKSRVYIFSLTKADDNSSSLTDSNTSKVEEKKVFEKILQSFQIIPKPSIINNDNAKYKFQCDPIEGKTFTTVVSQTGVKHPIIIWYDKKGETNNSQKYCEIVTERIKTAYKNNNLLITTGLKDGKGIICATDIINGSCMKILFALSPGDDPVKIEKQLSEYRAKGPIQLSGDNVPNF